METEELLGLVQELCTTEQVKELLRSARERAEKGHKREVRISGDDKADVIHGNLRDAINNRKVDIAAVYELLHRAEENGDQHVFYFRPRRGNAEALREQVKIESVGRALLGADWRDQVPARWIAVLSIELIRVRAIPTDA